MFTEINGLKINYLFDGKGEQNVLLLHGWGSSAKLFSAVIESLSGKFSVYAPDMPGFGESDEPQTPWNVDNYVDFIIAFCEKMNINECFILGHSFGGRIIIKLMSRENISVKIKRVVLTDSAGIRPKQSAYKKIKTRFYKIGKKFLSSKPIKKLFPNALDNFRKRNGSEDYNAASPIMRQCLVKVVNEDLISLLPNINVPALLIWGDKDDATPLSDGQYMEKVIPDAGLVVFEGCGHYAFLQQSARFCRILDSFFDIK